jgi:hypothetical protein
MTDIAKMGDAQKGGLMVFRENGCECEAIDRVAFIFAP